MALRQATTNCDFIKWNEVEEGTVIQCFFIETKPSSNQKFNDTVYIETLEGKRYGLSGSANLLRAIEQVRPGWYVEITYRGSTILESGQQKGSKCHQFDLAYDDERIHPLFSNDPSSRNEVAYTNSAASSQPQQTQQAPTPPALVRPEAPVQQQVQQPQQATTSVATPPTQAEAPVKKKSIF